MPDSQDRRHETTARTASGYLPVFAGLACLVLGLVSFGFGVSRLLEAHIPWLQAALAVLLGVTGAFLLAGLYMQQPNEARILTLFGRYTGTDRTDGLRWANPFALKRRISLRARNLNAPHIKVNDKRGNPVEISAAVVWRVGDTVRAVFEVDDFEAYVGIQAETAIRHLATQFAYDDGEDLAPGETTLRAGQDEVVKALVAELQARCAQAGVAVLEAKITHRRSPR